MLRDKDQYRNAVRIVHALEEKVGSGTATTEDRERLEAGREELLCWEWAEQGRRGSPRAEEETSPRPGYHYPASNEPLGLSRLDVAQYAEVAALAHQIEPDTAWIIGLTAGTSAALAYARRYTGPEAIRLDKAPGPERWTGSDRERHIRAEAARLRANGLAAEDILQRLAPFNQDRCDPPLRRDQLALIAREMGYRKPERRLAA